MIRCRLLLLAGQGLAVSLRLLFKLSQVDNTIPLCSPPLTIPVPPASMAGLASRDFSGSLSNQPAAEEAPVSSAETQWLLCGYWWTLVTTNTGRRFLAGL